MAFLTVLFARFVAVLPLLTGLLTRSLGFLSVVLTPFGSVVSSFIGTLLSPILRYVLFALLVAGLMGFSYLKGRHDDHVDTIQINQEHDQQQVGIANGARAAANKKFDSGKFNNRPSIVPGRVRIGTDGYARD